jgi:hypothetical protein
MLRAHVQVVLQYDLEQYEVGRPCWDVPLLVPLLHYTYQVSRQGGGRGQKGGGCCT